MVACKLATLTLLARMQGDKPKYQLVSRMHRKVDCTLLVVCSKHVVLCQERRLQSFSFDNVQERYAEREDG